MKNNLMKTATLVVVCVCLLLAACSKAEPLETGIGSFDYSQEFMESVTDDATGAVYSPAEGHIFLVVHLTPAGDTAVSLDEAQAYFQRGTSVIIAEETYEMYSLAFERIDKSRERFGLFFEVADKGYTKEDKPAIQLRLPSAPK